MLRLLGQLRPAAAHAGALLLRHACLTPPQAPGGSSAGSVVGGSSTGGPLVRGELLLSTLMATGKHAAFRTSQLAASLASALQTVAHSQQPASVPKPSRGLRCGADNPSIS